MKARLARFRKILVLAAAEEQKLRVQVGRSQARLKQQLDRLAELNVYRSGYAQSHAESRRLPSSHWKDYQNFLSRLDAALSAQRRLVADCEENLDAHRRQWMRRRRRVESLDKVRLRLEEQERVSAERREQRLLDDLPAAPAVYDEDA